jgi:hypothetical protein
LVVPFVFLPGAIACFWMQVKEKPNPFISTWILFWAFFALNFSRLHVSIQKAPLYISSLLYNNFHFEIFDYKKVWFYSLDFVISQFLIPFNKLYIYIKLGFRIKGFALEYVFMWVWIELLLEYWLKMLDENVGWKCWMRMLDEKFGCFFLGGWVYSITIWNLQERLQE